MIESTTSHNSPKNAPYIAKLLAFAPVAIFLAIALFLIAIDHNNGRAYFDHSHFHLPVILGLIKDFDISDYKAATAPGYHLIFASIGKFTGANVTLFKIVNALITSLFIGYLSFKLSIFYRPIYALILMLPITLSIYILPAGIWLLPDNLAWFAVAWMIFQIESKPFSQKQLIYIAIVLALAVFTRQTYLWLVSILWASGIYYLFIDKNKAYQSKYLLKCTITTGPAILILLSLTIIWQGLVPPSFQSIHHHISPSAPAFFLALIAIYGAFYLPIFYHSLKNTLNRKVIILGALIGFVSVIFITSNYDINAGRFGGLWNIVKVMPTIADKSLLLIVLSTFGGALFMALMQIIDKEKRFIIIVATAAFVTAMVVNQFVYERYFSGFIYILLTYIACHQKTEHSFTKHYRAYSTIAIFALINALLLYRNLNQSL